MGSVVEAARIAAFSQWLLDVWDGNLNPVPHVVLSAEGHENGWLVDNIS